MQTGSPDSETGTENAVTYATHFVAESEAFLERSEATLRQAIADIATGQDLMAQYKTNNRYYAADAKRISALDFQIFNLEIEVIPLPAGGPGRLLIYMCGCILLVVVAAIGIVVMRKQKRKA